MTEETPTKEEQDAAEAAIRRGRYLSGTWRGRWMSFVLTVLMFLESAVWTLMDIIRKARMNWAAKMHGHGK